MVEDWIKVEVGTPDKPQIMRVATICKCSRAEAFMGWFRLWSWLDHHTADGFVQFLSSSEADNICHISGIAAAFEAVGWLKFDSAAGSCQVLNWQRHNGKSAKKRAQDTRIKHEKRFYVRQMSTSEADKPANVDGKTGAENPPNVRQKSAPLYAQEREREYKKEHQGAARAHEGALAPVHAHEEEPPAGDAKEAAGGPVDGAEVTGTTAAAVMPAPRGMRGCSMHGREMAARLCGIIGVHAGMAFLPEDQNRWGLQIDRLFKSGVTPADFVKFLSWYQEAIGREFTPKLSKPFDLGDKWLQLIAAFQRDCREGVVA